MNVVGAVVLVISVVRTDILVGVIVYTSNAHQKLQRCKGVR